jgi:hypothetical protein
MHEIIIEIAVNKKIIAICGGFIKKDIQKSIESGRQLSRNLAAIQ